MCDLVVNGLFYIAIICMWTLVRTLIILDIYGFINILLFGCIANSWLVKQFIPLRFNSFEIGSIFRAFQSIVINPFTVQYNICL